MRHAGVDELGQALRSWTDLRDTGWTERAVARAVAERRLHRVRRGWYIDAATWQELWPETRHLAHVIAVSRDARGTTPVFSHTSAAVLSNLPLYRLQLPRVHVVMGGDDRCSAPDVLRHEGAVDDGDVTSRHGFACTTLERTVMDLSRTVTVGAGLAAADAAFSLIAGGPRRYDADRAGAFHDRLTQRASARGLRGIRTARRVVALADGRAERPGESVSRLQLIRLGFAVPRLQVPVAGRHGDYHVDFGLDDVNAFGEFDGKGKYIDEAMRSGRTIEEVLLEEKRREDWIRGTTQRRFARWGDEHIRTANDLGRRLASFGIVPSRFG